MELAISLVGPSSKTTECRVNKVMASDGSDPHSRVSEVTSPYRCLRTMQRAQLTDEDGWRPVDICQYLFPCKKMLWSYQNEHHSQIMNLKRRIAVGCEGRHT